MPLGQKVKLPAIPLGRDRQAGASRQCNITLYCAPYPMHPANKGRDGARPGQSFDNEISLLGTFEKWTG
jgi:hypothetical protein